MSGFDKNKDFLRAKNPKSASDTSADRNSLPENWEQRLEAARAERARNPKSASETNADSNSLPKNWEQRLEAARAERAKHLKKKAEPAPKKTVKAPPFPVGDSSKWLAQKTGDDEIDPADFDRLRHKAEDSLGTTDVLDDVELAAPLPPPKSVYRRSLRAIFIVAFAGFFGLGAGVVLSFSAAIGMGWLSMSDTSPDQTQSQTVVVAAAPVFMSVGVESLVLVAKSETSALPDYTTVTPVVTASNRTPILSPASAAGKNTAPVKSPGPKIDATGIRNSLVAGHEIIPNSVGTIFANPIYVSATPELLQTVRSLRDHLPILPENSNVNPMLVLASLSPPVTEPRQNPIVSAIDSVPPFAPAPTILESIPGAVPTVSDDRPKRLSVFDGEISWNAMLSPSEAEFLLEVSTLNPPPKKAIQVRTLPNSEIAFDLPDVGRPHNRARTLAEKLGYDSWAAGLINLVTIAPASVQEDQMSNHTERLNATGFSAQTVNRVNYRVSKTHVRYYRPQDEAVASAIAEEIGGQARDFTNTRNSLPQGRVEIYLQGGRNAATAAAAPRRKLTTAQRRARQKARLESSIVNKLRRGEQFGATR